MSTQPSGGGGGFNWAPVIEAGIAQGGAWSGARSARRAAKVAWKRTVRAYKHRYQWQVKDMRKAGLNPILSAYTGAGSVGNAQVADTGDIGAGARAMSGKVLQAAALKSQIDNVKTNTAKQAVEEELAREQVNTELTKQDANRADAAKTQADATAALTRLPRTSEEQDAQIRATLSQAQINSAKAVTENSVRALNNAQTGQIESTRGVDKLKTEATEVPRLILDWLNKQAVSSAKGATR